ncbi:hypothetical protein [Bartonella quintana]|uniref:hypothetical protein n=1 Tax=Bartonella quintana TaxID=803 RepID=UPI000305326B|nr:hypothetical protein [Bartonella quintana]QUG72564.1 hypothetical protein FOL54_06595 [Bartonella quintana]SQF96374.1 Uncharacterised protein [Bartonella quintana]
MLAENSGQINVTNVALTTKAGKAIGAIAFDSDNMIKLHGTITINNTFDDLGTREGGKSSVKI